MKENFISKYNIMLSRSYIADCYPDPIDCSGVSDDDFQKALDGTIDEVENYNAVKDEGGSAAMSDLGRMSWDDFISKYPTLSDIDVWFFGELETLLLSYGAKYVNE